MANCSNSTMVKPNAVCNSYGLRIARQSRPFALARIYHTIEFNRTNIHSLTCVAKRHSDTRVLK